MTYEVTSSIHRSKIFKAHVPKHILFEFLEPICIKHSKYIVFDVNSFKKLQYNPSTYLSFIEILRNYYHDSQQFYLDRELTYNHLITIIRQICKLHSIKIEKKVTYSKFDYNTDYYIYHV